MTVNYHQNTDGAEAVAEEIRNLGRRAIVVQGDASKCSDVARMTREAIRAFGRIDILVNNAGIYVACPIEDVKEADWDRVVQVNLKGVFLCCQAVGRHMIERKSGGTIINVASISAHMPEVKGGAYTPSKAGVIGLTRLLAVEWSKYNIRVNALSPGPIMTLLQRQAYPTEELLKARNSAVPMNRHGTPEEMAKIAVFLASEDASYITGADIQADGGSLASMFQLVHRLSGSA
jgi:NAD(P)-dependent dehydrogenase (short-subunit alcohol dehydrogenase family)